MMHEGLLLGVPPADCEAINRTIATYTFLGVFKKGARNRLKY